MYAPDPNHNRKWPWGLLRPKWEGQTRMERWFEVWGLAHGGNMRKNGDPIDLSNFSLVHGGVARHDLHGEVRVRPGMRHGKDGPLNSWDRSKQRMCETPPAAPSPPPPSTPPPPPPLPFPPPAPLGPGDEWGAYVVVINETYSTVVGRWNYETQVGKKTPKDSFAGTKATAVTGSTTKHILTQNKYYMPASASDDYTTATESVLTTSTDKVASAATMADVNGDGNIDVVMTYTDAANEI